MTDWMERTALELGAAIRRGELSPSEAAEGALDAIARRDGGLNSFLTVTGERAVRQARDLENRTGERGPLYGVPMALKDNLCTRGVPTTCASRILDGFRPPYDADAAERLDRAGTVLLGKLNMDEFAMGSTSETSCRGPVRNPWAPDRVPGGSSGGAAAAVAARLCWFALGSDTGGSIRQPAACCGVTGIKPTYGTVSRYGLIAYASSLDQIGPVARSAADCAAVLDVIQGRDRRDAASVERPGGSLLAGLDGSLRGLRVGLPVEFLGDGLERTREAAVRETARVLAGRGALVEECTLPVLSRAVPAYYVIACAEASSNLARYDGVKYGLRAEEYGSLDELYVRTRTQGFGAEVKRRILLGTFVLSEGCYDAYYRKALRVREQIRGVFARAFQRYDLLLTPVTPGPPPRLGESLGHPLAMYQSDRFTVPSDLAGLPALSMPCGLDGAGLPMGVQLIGPPMGEGIILRAAHAYQQETEHHRRTPLAGENGGGKGGSDACAGRR